MNIDLASLLQRQVFSLKDRFSSRRMPRSLTDLYFLLVFLACILSIGVIRLGSFWVPISLLLKTMLIVAILTGFPSVWNKINLIFNVFTAILLFLSQLANFCSSRLTLFSVILLTSTVQRCRVKTKKEGFQTQNIM